MPVNTTDYARVFSFSPNPACLVHTTSVQNVLYKVRFCIRAKQGLSLILGDVGMGKSSLLRTLHAELNDDPEYETALLTNARFKTDLALLKCICDAFDVRRRKAHIDQSAEFESFLLARAKQGRTVVLFVDEAQLLNGECLEVFRALLNFETDTHKLIQIVIAGQLGLGERLLQSKFRAIKSRIFAPCIVNAMTFEETQALLEARCKYFGVSNPFDFRCMERIYSRTDGVPRHLLNLAAMASELCKTTRQPATPSLIDTVADDLILRVHQEIADEQEEGAPVDAVEAAII
jgi:general secretion pathway protein A